MTESVKKCMVCAKPAQNLRGGICDVCQDKIRREAMGEQARNSENAERELGRHGVRPDKK
jgi:predicted amidophosphoribosyltransferase